MSKINLLTSSVVLKLCAARDFQVCHVAFWNFGKYASISIMLNTM